MTITNLDQIQDDDLFACTDEDGVTKSVTGAQFKELLDPPPPPPSWGGQIGIYHVIVQNTSDITVAGHQHIYNKDTGVEVSSITTPGEWIITGDRTRFENSTGNWTFGPLTNTTGVTSMEDMFYLASEFNGDVSMFDTSEVRNFKNMFFLAAKFNGDVSGWDVSKATTMEHMFNGANSFNSDLSNWNVSKVQNMNYMLRDCYVFNSDISGWDVHNVNNMDYMLVKANSLAADLSQWCVDPEPSHSFFYQGLMHPDFKAPVWGTCPRGENQ